MLISAVIPVYNSAVTLPLLLERVHASLSGLTDSFEILAVNDGSADDSLYVLKILSKTFAQLRIIDLNHNTGQHAATLIGMRQARGRLIFTMDDDLQHPPEAFAAMVEALTRETNVVYARATNCFNGMRSCIVSRGARYILRYVAGIPDATHSSTFRLMRASCAGKFSALKGNAFSIDGVLAHVEGIHSVAITFAPRIYGSSSYNFYRSFRLFLDTIRTYHSKDYDGLAGGKPLPDYTLVVSDNLQQQR